MDIQRILPWQQIADHLRPLVRSRSGIEGAAYGIAYGVASAMSSARQMDSADDVKPLIAGAAMGIVYGAVDESLLPKHSDGQ